ncbi:hypothetical protein Q4485_16970 [Granulosicoccaceae sp. 1_MG-2023]|nr:hypothetical protein [Granulosicoccaceae sp. 1_MG-2023]
MKRLSALLSVVLLSACQHTAQTVTAFQPADLSEISGLTTLPSGAYAAVNDSGNTADLFTLTDSLNPAQRFATTLENRDWEDMAFVDLPEGRLLVIADTGDNLRRHDASHLYFFRWPAEASEPVPAGQLRFRFEDGPVNCEAVFYAAAERRFYLLSKGRGESDIYTLDWPLPDAADDTVQLAEKQAVLNGVSPSAAGKLFAAVTGVNPETPTGAAISGDGRQLAVLTYRSVWLWQNPDRASWQNVLQHPPQLLGKHRLTQAEAISFSADGRSLVIASEGNPPQFKTLSPAR